MRTNPPETMRPTAGGLPTLNFWMISFAVSARSIAPRLVVETDISLFPSVTYVDSVKSCRCAKEANGSLLVSVRFFVAFRVQKQTA